VQQELVRENIEWGRKIRKPWNIRGRVTDKTLSLFLDIASAANSSETCHIEYLQNMRVQSESPHQKQNNVPQSRYDKCTSTRRSTVYTEQDA
jgi:hypothetical protein